MSDLHDVVRNTAASLNFLDTDDSLVPLDSLMIIDFVLALETAAALQIPTNRLRSENFMSVDSVAKMLAEI